MTDSLREGTLLSHYRIVAHLGGGGMGIVYKAEDTRLKRPVALKFLPADLTGNEEARQRFEQEAQAASALDHPNICTIYEIDTTGDDRMFIAMAFCDGVTLKKRLQNGPLPIDTALDIASRRLSSAASVRLCRSKAHSSSMSAPQSSTEARPAMSVQPRPATLSASS